MITLADYFMGRDAAYADSLTDEIRKNATETVAKANILIAHFQAMTKDKEPRNVNSGWRPASVNSATPGAAPRSRHLTAQAIDISDPEGDLDEWCLEHPEIMESVGLWQEHPSCTKGWAHVQIVPPKSGKRCFYP